MNTDHLKHLTLLLAFVLHSAAGHAQSSTRIFDRIASYPGSLGLANGDVLLFDKLDSVIIRVSPAGSVVWAKNLGFDLGVAGASERNDGSLYLFLLKRVPGVMNGRYPAYARLTAAGLPFGQMNVLGDTTFVGSCDRMVPIGNGFALLSPNPCAGQGPMHRVLPNGSVAWSQDHMFNQPSEMVLHNDGYLYGIWQREVLKYDPNTGGLVWHRGYFYLNTTHPAFAKIVSLPQGLALAFSQRPGGFGAPSDPAIALMDTSGSITDAILWNTGPDGIGSIDFVAADDRLILTTAQGSDRSVIFSCAHDLSAPVVQGIDFGSQALVREASVNVDDGLNFTGFVSAFGYSGNLLHVRTGPSQDITDCHAAGSYPTTPLVLDSAQYGQGYVQPYAASWTAAPLVVSDVTPVVEVHCLSTGIAPEEARPGFLLGPVPCDRQLGVTSAFDQAVGIVIMDATGRIVLARQLDPGPNDVDVSMLAPGTYLLAMPGAGTASGRQRFVVAR